MTRNNFRYATLVILTTILATAFALPATGQEEINVTRELKADGRLSVDNLSGSVIVSGWDRNEVRITGTLGRGTERLDVDGNSKRLKVEVVLPRKARNIKGSHLEITMPRGAQLVVSTVSADIEVTDLRGELSLQSVSGQIDVKADPKSMEAESVSGDLDLISSSDEFDLQTISGDIILHTKGSREINIDTISGDVELISDVVKRLSFESISGDLDFSGQIETRGRFHSQSGDLFLIFTGEPDAEFEIGTFSGDIRNAFGPEAKKSNRFNLGKTLEFTAGNGNASIEIESFSGDIKIRVK
ncbi:DUF4097 family beta strand repeat protein [bacterium]|nr:DUF4097 family beta strand repeat protein [bacterium]